MAAGGAERVQNFALAMAQTFLELGADAGLAEGEMAAALPAMVEELAERLAPSPVLSTALMHHIAGSITRGAIDRSLRPLGADETPPRRAL